MNEVALFGQNEEKWYTIEEIAELCGYASAHAIQSNPKILEILNQFSNSKDVRIGGYHNTKKYYSEKVLEAVKKYQILKFSPNALKDKETAVQGNVNYIGQATVKQTIDNLLDNPNTLQMLLTESLERNKKLGIENKELKEIISMQAPKVEFYDTVTQSEDSMDMRDVAITLNFSNLGRNKIFKILRDRKILDRNNKPYQSYVNKGYFKIVETENTDAQGNTHVNTKTVVFQKGLDFINKVLQEELKEVQEKQISGLH